MKYSHLRSVDRTAMGIPRPSGFDPMPKAARDLTTIQLTADTRDRLYRLKFRKTYDEFLQELCDLYDESDPKARK